jgi:hypothetical protein
MTTIALEGVGATIAFGTTTGFTNDLVSLTLPEKSREALETTHLGTVGAKTYKPAKLKNVGTISCEFDTDPEAPALIDGDVEQIVITFPALEGFSVGTKLTFSGFVTSEGGEEFKPDTLMRTKVTIQVSGDMDVTDAVAEASS